MAWIFDTYSMNKGHSVLGVVTGKPLSVGGSLGREEATARGALYCIQAMSVKQGKRISEYSVAIQGFGNVGANLARLLHGDGAKVVALSDSRGGVYNADGIDVPAALAHKQERGTLEGSRERRARDERGAARAPLRHPRALCARAGHHRRERRPRSRRRVICEGANGPVTPTADAILEDRGILVLPDVLANAGGVVVSYFEWVQGLQEYFWREDEVNAKLHDIVARAFEEAWQTRDRYETSLRMSSYGLAVQRVAEATTTRGLYP